MQTTTPKQEHRAKNEARGMDALDQAREIARYRAMRSELTSTQLEVLYEFKAIGSPGATASALSYVIKLSKGAAINTCSHLKLMGALEPTGHVTERSHMLRITRKGINILQAR